MSLLLRLQSALDVYGLGLSFCLITYNEWFSVISEGLSFPSPLPPCHPILGMHTVDLIQCNIIQHPIASEL